MSVIIHGQNIATSRNYFFTLREKIENPITLSGDKITVTDLTEAFNSNMLFFEKKNIFLEEFFFKKNSIKQLDSLLLCINTNSKTHDIVIWEPKELTKKQIGSLLNFTEKKFDIPKNIFLFLENIYPKNSKLIQLFYNTTQTEEAEFVFFMMIRQTRMLLALKDNNSKETIDEIKKMPVWQKDKMQRQASSFTLDELILLYKKLFKVESDLKTGKLSLPLAQSIAFLLLDI